MFTDEQIAFLARETGWTLTYIRELPLAEVRALLEELAYQKQLEQYQAQAAQAAMIATMVNLWSKDKINPRDIMGKPPKRASAVRREERIWMLAKQAGLRIPKDIS